MLQFTEFSPLIFGVVLGLTVLFWCWFAGEKELVDMKRESASMLRYSMATVLFFLSLFILVTSDFVTDIG